MESSYSQNTISHPIVRSDEDPLVSIIVPVYNAEYFLNDMLNSLLTQTYNRLEIICINDGSTDNSVAILEECARNDNRISIFNSKKRGAGQARNLGLKQATGSYLLFVDADDFIETYAIEQLVSAAKQNHTDIVVFDLDRYYNSKAFFEPFPGVVSKYIPANTVFNPKEIDNLYQYLVGFTVNKLYLRSFLVDLNLLFPTLGAHEDMPFTYIALSSAQRVLYLNKTLYHYRDEVSSSLSTTTNDDYEYMLQALECLRNWLIDRNLWITYERTYVNYVLHMCTWKQANMRPIQRLQFRKQCNNVWLKRLKVLGYQENYFFYPEYYTFINDCLHMSLSRKSALWLYAHLHKK